MVGEKGISGLAKNIRGYARTEGHFLGEETNIRFLDLEIHVYVLKVHHIAIYWEFQCMAMCSQTLLLQVFFRI